MARELRVLTPDGHVWFVRRRWAKRRRPWARGPDRPGARFAAEEELPTEEERIVPPLADTFSNVHNDGSTPQRHQDDRHAAANLVWAMMISFVVFCLLISAFVDHVAPWLLPWLADNLRPLATAAAVVALLVVLDRLQRPGWSSCSARAWPTPRGVSGGCGDGGAAGA